MSQKALILLILFISIIGFIILLFIFYSRDHVNSIAVTNTNEKQDNINKTYLSPDGDNLVTLEQESHSFSLRIVNLNTNAMHLIQSTGINEPIHSIIWTKESDRFYYAITRENPEVFTTLLFVDLTHPDPFASSEVIFEYGDLLGKELKIISIQDESLILQADQEIYSLSKNSEPGTNPQLIKDLSSVFNTERQNPGAKLDLGLGYSFVLPKDFNLKDHLVKSRHDITPGAKTDDFEVYTKVDHQEADNFGPAIGFFAFSTDSTFSVSDLAQEVEYFYCPINDSSREQEINTIPVSEITGSSDYCEDGTEIFYRKYYTFKPQGQEESLAMIVYTESEEEYLELKDDFNQILNSISKN